MPKLKPQLRQSMTDKKLNEIYLFKKSIAQARASERA